MKFPYAKLGLGLALGLAALTAQAQEVTLKAASAFSKDSFFDRKFERFIKDVNEHGKGVVQINFVGGPESMPPFEVGNAVRAGVIDLANTTGVFFANMVPEALALSFTPLSMKELRANARLRADGQNPAREGQYGVAGPYHRRAQIPHLDHQEAHG